MNTSIIDQFNLLVKQIEAEYLNAQMENNTDEIISHRYRLKSVKKALDVIRRLDFEIVDLSDLKNMPGIGPGTIRRIKEILETGQLAEIKQKYGKKKQKKIDSIQELEKVIGIGDRTAKKMVTEYGITSIDSLKKAIKSGKITVSKSILLGLKYYGVVQLSIPRNEVADTEIYLERKAKEIDPKLEIMICGSYRRGKPTSNDMDILMYNPAAKLTKHISNPESYNMKPYLKQYIDVLTKEGFLLDHMTDKHYNMKYMGICQYKKYPVRRIDIRFMPYKSLAPAMLYFTGPFELNTIMRSEAKKRNMLLNEYGLFKVNSNGSRTLVDVKSEADIFKILGMEYLTPEEREAFSVGKSKKL